MNLNHKLNNNSSIWFDADFESGNLEMVREKEKNCFEIFIRNDSNVAANN